MVPVDGAAAAAAAVAAVASVESDPSNEVEEGEEFAAYCRRGRGRRRVEMEDRHVAKVALGGDPEVVSSIDATSPFSVMNLFAHFLRNTLDLPDHGFGGGNLCDNDDGGITGARARSLASASDATAVRTDAPGARARSGTGRD